MSSSSILILPAVSIQPTYRDIIGDVHSGTIPNEDIWISCYKTGEASIHGKANVVLDEVNRDLVTYQVRDGDVKIVSEGRFPQDRISVSSPSLGIHLAKIFPPARQYADPERSNQQRPHRITAFDVSPDRSQIATGFLDGTVHLYPTSSTAENIKSYKQLCASHKSTVTSLKFFPSSRVLLSSGADFAINVIPADPLQTPTENPNVVRKIEPVRSLKGHSRSVTDTAIVSRGRNVLSSSVDSTLRLWDVGSGSEISFMSSATEPGSPIMKLSLGERGGEIGRSGPDGEEVMEETIKDIKEVDTDDKIVFCALQNGFFQAFDLRTKKSTFYVPVSSKPLSSIDYSPSANLVATGSSNGEVVIYDTRSVSTPLTSFSRSSSSIEDLSFIYSSDTENTDVKLAVGSADGLGYVANVRPHGPRVEGEIVGGDCDAVRIVKVRGTGDDTQLWTACDDGIVRMYKIW